MRVAIVAASSVVPRIEFAEGLRRLEKHGFEPGVHPSVFGRRDFVFSGTDRVRAEALVHAAWHDPAQVVWAARGGYGAIRLLPWLEEATQKSGAPPRKLLVGFSDATALLDYARVRWGWATLHAPMVAMADARGVDRVFKKTADLVRGGCDLGWTSRVKSWSGSVAARGPVVGGNLTVWNALTGTPFETSAEGCIAFFEDVGESPSRLDRTVSQLYLSGRLHGARALLLGGFKDCEDVPPNSGTGRSARPVRPRIPTRTALKTIFLPIAEALRCPVFYGAPVGHGPSFDPLPLGASIRISIEGKVTLESWTWSSKKPGTSIR